MRLQQLSLAFVLCVGCGSDRPDVGQDAETTGGDGTSDDASDGQAEGAEGNSDEDTGEDGGSNGAQGCDLWEQDCPESEKCFAYNEDPGECCVDATKCVPVTGEGVMFDACTREEDGDDCGVGLFCLAGNSNATGPGVCIQLCDSELEESCPGWMACVPAKSEVAWGCVPTCHPLDNATCPDPYACYFHNTTKDFVCVSPDAETMLGRDGAPCETPLQCSPGLSCITQSQKPGCTSDACCTPICDLSRPDEQCGPGEACESVYDGGDTPPGYEDVGMCSTPG